MMWIVKNDWLIKDFIPGAPGSIGKTPWLDLWFLRLSPWLDV